MRSPTRVPSLVLFSAYMKSRHEISGTYSDCGTVIYQNCRQSDRSCLRVSFSPSFLLLHSFSLVFRLERERERERASLVIPISYHLVDEL